jgi:hypothetical protein
MATSRGNLTKEPIAISYVTGRSLSLEPISAVERIRAMPARICGSPSGAVVELYEALGFQHRGYRDANSPRHYHQRLPGDAGHIG